MRDEIINLMNETKRRHSSHMDSIKSKPKSFNKLIEHIKAKRNNRNLTTDTSIPPSSSSSLEQNSNHVRLARIRSKSIGGIRDPILKKSCNLEVSKHDFETRIQKTPTLCFKCDSFINEQEGLSCRSNSFFDLRFKKFLLL